MDQDDIDVQGLLAAIVSSSDDAILSKDRDAVITSWNDGAERLYGWTAEEAIGQPVNIIVPADRHGEELTILNRILGGERIDHYETQRVTKRDKRIDVSLSVSPVHNRQGDIVGASVIARDITNRKRLEHLEREIDKRDFIARAAHELKNPLTTIAGMAQILRDKEDELDAEEKGSVYGALIRQSDRANRLITDLLELARVESGQLAIELTLVDLHAVVDGSIDAAAIDDRTRVENRIESGITALADPFRLEEVFVNLFSNSAKYGATLVTVFAVPGEGTVRIEVTDDGPGIPESLVPTVFDAFTRGSDSGVPGSGLGLSIARKLCEAFGGTLDHEAPPDGGARFVLTLRHAAG